MKKTLGKRLDPVDKNRRKKPDESISTVELNFYKLFGKLETNIKRYNDFEVDGSLMNLEIPTSCFVIDKSENMMDDLVTGMLKQCYEEPLAWKSQTNPFLKFCMIN
jgi:hypothetical protein